MADDKKNRILRLLELIEDVEKLLKHIKSSPHAFLSEVRQYEKLKNRYESELFEVLTAEFGVRLPIAA